MRRTFQLALPNGPFGDPLVVARVRWLPRIILLDCGDVARLTNRTLLDVTDVLVSHAHVDHVFGLAGLLRARLHRPDRPLRIVGPPGMAEHVRCHLHGYTWNLLPAFPLDLTIVEVARDSVSTMAFPRDEGFEPALVERNAWDPGAPVLEDDLLAVHAAVLEHGSIPSIGYAVREHVAHRVDAERLARSGLSPGPWLDRLKSALRRGPAPGETVDVPGTGPRPVRELAATLVRERPGDSVAYAADLADAPANRAAVEALAAGVRALVLESYFLERDRALAEQSAHLTAAAAGTLARRIAPRALHPFHVSPRYERDERSVWDELAAAASPVPVEPLPAGTGRAADPAS